MFLKHLDFTDVHITSGASFSVRLALQHSRKAVVWFSDVYILYAKSMLYSILLRSDTFTRNILVHLPVIHNC
jgi:hypothetical protein